MGYDKPTEIRDLLEIYFDGATTPEQERRLKEYFLSEEVPYAKAMFAGFSEAARETYSGDIMIGTATKKPRRRSLYIALSAAASLLLAVGLAWTLIPEKQSEVVYCYMNGEPVTDLDIASRQAQMVARILESSAKVSADGIALVAEASKPIEELSHRLQMLGITEENY